MAFTLMKLPYSKDALDPVISAETLEYHHGKHHKAYVDKLNELVPGTPYAGMTLDQIVVGSFTRPDDKKIFNNAAQVWNHDFYWHSLAPKAGGDPTGKIAAAIDKSFGSFAAFKDKFSKAAIDVFGTGWAWLVKNADGTLAIEPSFDAETPFASGATCLLTIDVWEHAYYIDYRNARPRYVEAFWKLVNWDFVNKNLG